MMRAVKIPPTDASSWHEQPLPVIDGPHRVSWKTNNPIWPELDKQPRSNEGTPGGIGCKTGPDIDAGGYYSYSRRLYLEGL